MAFLKNVALVLAVAGVFALTPSCLQGGDDEDAQRQQAQAWVTEQLVGSWVTAGEAGTTLTFSTPSPASEVMLSRCASRSPVAFSQAWACLDVTSVPVVVAVAFSDGRTLRFSGNADVLGDPGSGTIHVSIGQDDSHLFAELQQGGALAGTLTGLGDFTATRPAVP